MSQGSAPLVADRNGNEKRLVQIPQGLVATSPSGSVKTRDGSLNDPIHLGLLQAILDGKAALVRNGAGVIGVAVPTGDDMFLAYIGGVVQWVSTIPRTNVFDEGDIQPQTGKLVTISCVINGQVTLGYMDLGTADYLTSIDGIVRGAAFCDAASVTELDGLFGCIDGVFSQITGAEGQVLTVNSSGKWTAEDRSLGINLLNSHYLVACKLLGSGIPNGQESWSNTGTAVGSFDVTLAGLPEDTEYAWIRGATIYDINAAATTVTAYVKANGLLVTEVLGQNFGEVSDKCAERTWVKVTNKLFTYEVACTSSNVAQGSAGAKLEVLGWA